MVYVNKCNFGSLYILKTHGEFSQMYVGMYRCNISLAASYGEIAAPQVWPVYEYRPRTFAKQRLAVLV